LATEVMLEIYVTTIEAVDGWLRKNGDSQQGLGCMLMETRRRLTLQQKVWPFLYFSSLFFIFTSFIFLFWLPFSSKRFFLLAFCSSNNGV